MHYGRCICICVCIALHILGGEKLLMHAARVHGGIIGRLGRHESQVSVGEEMYIKWMDCICSCFSIESCMYDVSCNEMDGLGVEVL